MRVLFLISTLGQGRGGHYHSLNHISKELGSKIDSKIIAVGPGRSEIIELNPHYLKRVFFNGINVFSAFREIHAILREFKPTIIHCFDVTVYNFIKTIVFTRKYRFVLNKCGGPNPIEFPMIENLILFSKENEIWFRNRRQFISTKIYLIPNRVVKIHLPEYREFTKDPGFFNFVRICRIGKVYQKSIIDSINLADVLSRRNIKVKLFIIGKVQDEEVYQDLLIYSENKEIEFIVEEQHIIEASQLLYLADAVIATGRGIMEASSLGLPVLTPAKNSLLPILINNSNFGNFFETNFSERNLASTDDLKNNLKLIERLIGDTDFYKSYSDFSLNSFNIHFDVVKVGLKYIEVYNNSFLSKDRISSLSDIILKIKTLKDFYINSKNRN